MAKMYWHVLGQDKAQGAQWFHQFSADNRLDARDEVRSLKSEGYRAIVIRSDVDPMVIVQHIREHGATSAIATLDKSGGR